MDAEIQYKAYLLNIQSDKRDINAQTKILLLHTIMFYSMKYENDIFLQLLFSL